MPADLLAMRDLALQKIGRNLVNFQRMEAMLKFVLKFGSISVPISKLAPHLNAADRSLRRKPMGTLVDRAAEALHGEPPPGPSDLKEVWITYSFTLEGEGASADTWRKAMRVVVKERNRLVHRTAAECNLTSIESCRALCDELDAQRERIVSSYQHLESLVRAIKESHEELASWDPGTAPISPS
jgi:hypothetical protein